jgi:hypothetical protein
MKRAARNPLTGRMRKRVRHYTTRQRRGEWSITVKEAKLLNDLAKFGQTFTDCLDIGLLVLLISLIQTHGDPQLIHRLIRRVLLPYMAVSFMGLLVVALLDADVGDIPEEVENAQLFHLPKTHDRLAWFGSESDCEEFTSFFRYEIREMMELFVLPEWILVPRGRPDGKNYLFHREELMLMLLNKMTEGRPISKMARSYGYKCDSRLGAGIRYLVKYLDERYDFLIGATALMRWRYKFPEFAESIRNFIAKEKISVDSQTGAIQISPGVWFNPGSFCIAGLVDCKDYTICRPHSGPAGYYPGAERRPWWDVFQRAFFCAHHRHHAVKMLTFLLPNGLYGAVWGPASARRNDARLVFWSQIDHILFVVQHVFFAGLLYCFFGDKAFRGAVWSCIRTYHDQGDGAPLTQRQFEEDRVMRTARQRIELNYGGMASRFPFVNREDQFKLEKDGVHALRMIRLAHFFWNIRCCYRGNLANAEGSFDTSPPTVERYLSGQFYLDDE